MSPKKKQSVKHVLIDKANATIVSITSLAAFIVIFSLVSGKALYTEMQYQDRLATAKQNVYNQLQSDVTANNQLVASYQKFTTSRANIIGGSTNGNGPSDGNNAKIILDALPAQYDFPALTTSLDKLLTSQSVSLQSISGNDLEATQGSAAASSGTPQPIQMPFSFTISGDYQSVQNVITSFQDSIRPFQFLTMKLSGDQGSLTLDVDAQTFYQPGKTFNISSQVVK